MKTVLVTAAVLTMSACVGTKPVVPYQRDAQFEIGRTTFQQVIKKLGEPNASTRHADGSQSLQYFYSETQVNADGAIPHIGSFRGSNVMVSSFVSMKFGKDNTLTDYSAISSKTTSGSRLDSAIAGRPGH